MLVEAIQTGANANREITTLSEKESKLNLKLDEASQIVTDLQERLDKVQEQVHSKDVEITELLAALSAAAALSSSNINALKATNDSLETDLALTKEAIAKMEMDYKSYKELSEKSFADQNGDVHSVYKAQLDRLEELAASRGKDAETASSELAVTKGKLKNALNDLDAAMLDKDSLAAKSKADLTAAAEKAKSDLEAAEAKAKLLREAAEAKAKADLKEAEVKAKADIEAVSAKSKAENAEVAAKVKAAQDALAKSDLDAAGSKSNADKTDLLSKVKAELGAAEAKANVDMGVTSDTVKTASSGSVVSSPSKEVGIVAPVAAVAASPVNTATTQVSSVSSMPVTPIPMNVPKKFAQSASKTYSSVEEIEAKHTPLRTPKVTKGTSPPFDIKSIDVSCTACKKFQTLYL